MTDKGSGNEVAEAEKLIGMGKIPEAIELLEKLVSGMPKDWKPIEETEGSIGITFWDMDEFMSYVEKHKEVKKEILWMQLSYSKAYYLLAYLAMEQGDLNKALKNIDKSLELEPDHPLALCEKAMILTHTKDKKQAIELYEKAIKARSWTAPAIIARAMRGIGVALIDEKKLDKAEEYLLKSLELEPENQLAKNELVYIAELRKGAKPESQLKIYKKQSE